MDTIKFIFWEVIKVAGLALAGMVAAKIISSLGRPKQGTEQGSEEKRRPKLAAWRIGLYAVLLILVGLGARILGEDWAAAIYNWAAEGDLARSQVAKACDNGQRAVDIRPKELRYWRVLERARITKGDFAPVLRDEGIIRSLNGGDLPEEDAIRVVVSHFALGHYDQVIALTGQMIRQNPYYPASFVFQGSAYLAEKKYGEAEKRFLSALQILPTQVDAVNGLAEAYFLSGEKSRALAVLDATKHYPFALDARKHFDDLKVQYGR